MLSTLHNGSQLRTLLKATFGVTLFSSVKLPEHIQRPEFFSALESANLFKKERQNQWSFPGYAKVQVAIRALQLGEPERPVLAALTWQEFEEFVAQVLKFHDFNVRHRFRFSTNRRYEIDIVAVRNPIILCIDCKQYGVRLGKTASLRNASEEQLLRTKVLADNFSRLQAKLECLDWQRFILIPILVTMMNEDIQFHNQIPIVPASFFNAFLLRFEEKMDDIISFQPSSGRQLRLV